MVCSVYTVMGLVTLLGRRLLGLRKLFLRRVSIRKGFQRPCGPTCCPACPMFRGESRIAARQDLIEVSEAYSRSVVFDKTDCISSALIIADLCIQDMYTCTDSTRCLVHSRSARGVMQIDLKLLRLHSSGNGMWNAIKTDGYITVLLSQQDNAILQACSSSLFPAAKLDSLLTL